MEEKEKSSSEDNSEEFPESDLTPFYRVYVYGEDNDKIEEIFIDPNVNNTLGGPNGIYSLISAKFKNQYTPLEHTMKIKLANVWYTINDMNVYNFCISGNLSSGDVIKIKLLKNDFIDENNLNEGKENYNPDQDILNANKVKNNPVPIEKKIACSLCRQNSDYLYERLLNLYGPFKYKNKIFYAHFLCLIYIPEIEISDKDTFKNPGRIIYDYVGIKCAFCSEKGATLCCCYNNTKDYENPFNLHCKNRFHYLCAIKSGCKISRLTYNVLCPKHIRYGYPSKKSEQEKIENENKNEVYNLEKENSTLTENDGKDNINEIIMIDEENEDNEKENNNNENSNDLNKKKKNNCFYCGLTINEDECIKCKICANYFHKTCVGIKVNNSHVILDDDDDDDEDEKDYICPECLAKDKNK